MHGEYKTPGGKMVVVDFVVADGALYGVQVSGDFFLYPEEALGQIAGALEGIAYAESADEMAARIERALAPGVMLLGFSAHSVARAVSRALGKDRETDAGQ